MKTTLDDIGNVTLLHTLKTATSTTPTPTPMCSNEISEAFGTISSPGWPNKYQSNVDQCWKIKCGQNQQIQISFHKFDLEYHFACM